MFLDAFRNPLLEPLEDARQLQVGGARLALTTDSYVVSPLFFPGGDIGDLAVNGTVNDLAVSGATPLYLSAGFILEEGFPVADLTTIVGVHGGPPRRRPGCRWSPATPRWWSGARPTAATSTRPGVGVVERDLALAWRTARPGDAVIVSGPIGDHGVTIMLARGELDIEADLTLRHRGAERDGRRPARGGARRAGHARRDPRRGGHHPQRDRGGGRRGRAGRGGRDPGPHRGARRRELLGIDPMYVASEGRLVAVVDGEQADRGLAALRAHPLGEQAAVIGHVTADPPGIVLLKTAFGGTRIVDLLVGDPLPRIC